MSTNHQGKNNLEKMRKKANLKIQAVESLAVTPEPINEVQDRAERIREMSKLRFKRYAERVKADPETLERIRETNRLRSQKYAEKQKADPVTREAYLARRREIQNDFRRRKRRELMGEVNVEEDDPGYKRKLQLYRAVVKVKEALPTEPFERRHVIRTLYADFGKLLGLSAQGKPSQVVNNFFHRDDISQEDPERNIFRVAVRSDGKQENVKVRFMVVSMQCAFETFKLDHPSIKLSYSAFKTLKPRNILPMEKTPADHVEGWNGDLFGSVVVKEEIDIEEEI